jgi:molybdate transport system substrate-binding protein
MTRFFIVATIIALQLTAFSQDQLTVAAAADLRPVLKEIASMFEEQTGSHVKLSFGSSGTFFAQIQNGAPYDVFFSADLAYPQKLAEAGLADSRSLYRYATGKIVLWVRNGSGVDVSQGLSLAADPAVRKFAIANPAHAPYGRAAEAALKREGLWEKVLPKLVLGENISQTAQFVQSGNADAGILALSLVLTPALKNQGSYYEVPQELYPPLEQAVVVLTSSKHKEVARKFVDFLQRSETKSLLNRSGFTAPGRTR